MSWTRAVFVGRGYGGPTGRYFQKLSWASASFAIMSDIAMGTMGGKLKIKEKLTGRFADILSWMFIITATLRRFKEEGERKEDLPFVHYSMSVGFGEIQNAFDGIFANASLFHVPGRELPRVLSELHSALRPHGVLFASNPRGDHEGWSGQRYGHYMEFDTSKRYFEAAGFEVIHHYYRPQGKPFHQQPWLAIVSRAV